MVREQRVLIIDLPRVMREIIRQFLTAPGIDVVGETSGDVDLSELVHATRADVVVMGVEDTRLSTAARRLLANHPRIRLVGVAADGRQSVMYELRMRRQSLGEVSLDGLVHAVRGARGRSSGGREGGGGQTARESANPE